MARIDTTPVVAGVANKMRRRRLTYENFIRCAMGCRVYSVIPKDAVATPIATAGPGPAFIWRPTLNPAPEALHNGFHASSACRIFRALTISPSSVRPLSTIRVISCGNVNCSTIFGWQARNSARSVRFCFTVLISASHEAPVLAVGSLSRVCLNSASSASRRFISARTAARRSGTGMLGRASVGVGIGVLRWGKCERHAFETIDLLGKIHEDLGETAGGIGGHRLTAQREAGDPIGGIGVA